MLLPRQLVTPRNPNELQILMNLMCEPKKNAKKKKSQKRKPKIQKDLAISKIIQIFTPERPKEKEETLGSNNALNPNPRSVFTICVPRKCCHFCL